MNKEIVWVIIMAGIFIGGMITIMESDKCQTFYESIGQSDHAWKSLGIVFTLVGCALFGISLENYSKTEKQKNKKKK